MTLVTFVVTLVVLGIIFYLIYRYIPMPEIAKTILSIVFVVVAILLMLDLFGVMKLPFPLK